MVRESDEVAEQMDVSGGAGPLGTAISPRDLNGAIS